MSSTTNDTGKSYMVVTPDNHVAFIFITALTGLVWSVFIIGIRLYLRLRLSPPFGYDDAVALIGTVIGVAQTSVTLTAARNGVGKRKELLMFDPSDAGLQSIYIAWLLYPVVVCSAKVSIALLISRLTATQLHLRASYILTGLSVFWGAISVLLAAFQCRLPRPWDIGAVKHCENMFAQWVVVETGNMLIEFLIPGLIILIVWNLRVPMMTKITVVFAFSLQLLVAIPTVFRLILIQQTTSDENHNDSTFEITDTVIVTEVVMHFSLIAATFPCLRKFLQAFDMNMGATTHMNTELDIPNNTSSGGSCTLEPLEPSSRRATSLDHKCNTLTLATISSDLMTSSSCTEGRGTFQTHRPFTDIERRSIESENSERAMISRTQK
ncbi:hypothetical protein BBP40_005845 [Aspergillus hancockii]|nr:hypothetical protein BBP40_005845 [Aspergillus hancockii]